MVAHDMVLSLVLLQNIVNGTGVLKFLRVVHLVKVGDPLVRLLLRHQATAWTGKRGGCSRTVTHTIFLLHTGHQLLVIPTVLAQKLVDGVEFVWVALAVKLGQKLPCLLLSHFAFLFSGGWWWWLRMAVGGGARVPCSVLCLQALYQGLVAPLELLQQHIQRGQLLRIVLLVEVRNPHSCLILRHLVGLYLLWRNTVSQRIRRRREGRRMHSSISNNQRGCSGRVCFIYLSLGKSFEVGLNVKNTFAVRPTSPTNRTTHRLKRPPVFLLTR
mmetsp:Transcript_24385/g.31667  ORF Transcript_24385/g.31667 Transcript_24385/m.31667 type:complete len:271 (+) Transcript_24385:885-1697(+)